jgi:hypothetical protein
MAICSEISRKVSATRDGATVTRVLEVEPYAAWWDMAGLLLGGVRLVGGGLYRIPPLGDPVITWAFCKSVDVEGVGTFTGTGPTDPRIMLRVQNYYRRARLTVQYETLQNTEQEIAAADSETGGGGGGDETSEVELATNTWEISGQQLTLPHQYYKWRYNNQQTLAASGTNVVKTMPQITSINTRNFVVNRPLNAMVALYGRVNYYSFRVGGITWPAETLRYDGSSCTQKITNQGVKFFELQHKFAVQPIYDRYATSSETVSATDPSIITVAGTTDIGFVGWNRIYRPDRDYWDRVVSSANSLTGLYQYDKDIIQPGVTSGFKLLFHPRAY